MAVVGVVHHRDDVVQQVAVVNHLQLLNSSCDDLETIRSFVHS